METNTSSKLLITVALTSSSININPMSNSTPSLLQESVITSPTVSKSGNLPGLAQSWEEVRIAKIKALRGRYRNALTDSEDFAQQKINELEIEGE